MLRDVPVPLHLADKVELFNKAQKDGDKWLCRFSKVGRSCRMGDCKWMHPQSIQEWEDLLKRF